jgi:drug/metabolite transporter (DMT)-like permease
MGAALCILSAAAFGTMAIFGKLAYDEGLSVGDLLLVRFGLAAVALVAIAAAVGTLRGLARRTVIHGLLMGAVLYTTQSTLFFSALERMDASVLALLLYTYPALVTLAAILLRRERATTRRFAALGLALLGTGLVLAGAGTGGLDPLGTVMGLAAAATYSGYILIGDRVVAGVPPLALAALVTAGATASFATAGLIRGIELPQTAAGWGWVGAMALLSTVVAILAFFAGLARVGPSAAAILSTFEPVVTVVLAAAAFGEQLTGLQLAGGALVLLAVVVLQSGGGVLRRAWWRIPRTRPAPAGWPASPGSPPGRGESP